jgi:hypothetical protein
MPIKPLGATMEELALGLETRATRIGLRGKIFTRLGQAKNAA